MNFMYKEIGSIWKVSLEFKNKWKSKEYTYIVCICTALDPPFSIYIDGISHVHFMTNKLGKTERYLGYRI